MKVDPDHLRKYPNCGVIGPPLGRMSNLKEAVIHYPWVVKIVQKNRRIDPLEEWAESNTQGGIITERCKTYFNLEIFSFEWQKDFGSYFEQNSTLF